MKLCFNELLLALSYALDCVEHDVLGVTTNHSKRVAYVVISMGRQYKLSIEQLSDLAACALLHDNALTEYLQEEYTNDKENYVIGDKGAHCTKGERNIRNFPFYDDTKNAVLYHHENADGSGPFHKKGNDIPFFAMLIHISDEIDARYDLSTMTEEKYLKMKDFVYANKDILFSAEACDLFLSILSYEKLCMLTDENIDELIKKTLPYTYENYSPKQIKEFSSIFAKIIDYKSTFTCLHSVGLADKTYQMADYYGYKEEDKTELYFAACLHDIGKLAIDLDILEKPGKLTEEEFIQMKNHALISYQILSSVTGLEEISKWASYHHEKLDGSGYPFGYSAKDLNFPERLIGCLDIYQALCESRPYKEGKTHEQAISILYEMSNSNVLDKDIVKDIDFVFSQINE